MKSPAVMAIIIVENKANEKPFTRIHILEYQYFLTDTEGVVCLLLNCEEGKFFDFENLFAEHPKKLDYLNLIQISEVALESGGQIFEHKQICFEISYIVSGKGFFYTNNTVLPVQRGDIHVIAKGDLHKIITNPCEKLRYICLGFDFWNLPDQKKAICDFYNTSPDYIMRSEGDIRYLFDMLINEFYMQQEDTDFALESIIKLILIKVYRCFLKSTNHKGISKAGTGGSSTIYKIIKYIDSNIYDVKTVGDVAESLNFTANYISHTFKTKMGISLLGYIKKKKLEAAKVLLEHKNMSVTEISELLHFDSVQSLSRGFKQEFGITPTQYINNIQNK